MTHPLALSVIHDAAHYDARCLNAKTMRKRAYRAYLLELVNAQARRERREFDARYKPSDIETAWKDVCDYMESHMRDIARVASEDARAGA